MNKRRNEISYYQEIQNYIENQIISNFRLKSQSRLGVFWGIGELKSNLIRMRNDNPDMCECVRDFLLRVPPLNLDVFALITNGHRFEILILEVKLVNSVGLKEWSQLIGYCLVSAARYGLLVNIDKGASPRLLQMLTTEDHLSHIRTQVKNKQHEHLLGFMQWDSLTQNFEYSNLGTIKSISDLSIQIIERFV